MRSRRRLNNLLRSEGIRQCNNILLHLLAENRKAIFTCGVIAIDVKGQCHTARTNWGQAGAQVEEMDKTASVSWIVSDTRLHLLRLRRTLGILRKQHLLKDRQWNL
jgi:hypothetical protein